LHKVLDSLTEELYWQAAFLGTKQFHGSVPPPAKVPSVAEAELAKPIPQPKRASVHWGRVSVPDPIASTLKVTRANWVPTASVVSGARLEEKRSLSMKPISGVQEIS
jgi:hypothetical protein